MTVRMNDVSVTGWYLTNTTPGHNKFYLICLGDNGVLSIAWGRIGTQGQSKVQKFPTRADAETVAMRQLYAKASKGYDRINDDIRFKISGASALAACEQNTAYPFNRLFWDAVRVPQFEQDKKSVLEHYEQFLERAQKLLDTAGSQPFEAVYADFEELEAAWKAIEDAHGKAQATFQLTQQTLHQSLLSGGLA